MTARKHLARRAYGRQGLVIDCRCGKYEPIAGTVRVQEDAHRAHRVEMGEPVKPRTPGKVERLEADVERLRAECDALKDRLHRAAMTKTWTNEDGKKFVFVEDIVGPLLGLDAAGRAE